MVDKLKALLNQFRKVIVSLTPSQRLTLGLGVALIVASVSALILFSTRTQYEVLANVSHLSPEERRNLEQMLDEDGVEWKLEGTTLSVEQGTRQKIVMKMDLDKKMPNSRLAFEWLYEQTPLNTPTPTAMSEKIRLSRALELESVINSLEWVQSSKVTVTEGNDLDPLKQRRHPTKAMVNINTRHHKKVDHEDVSAVRALVTYAIPKLKDKYVGIVIDGRPYIFKQSSREIQQTDEWTARKIEYEERSENVLKSFFLGENGGSALFRKMQVAVNVEFNRELIKNHKKTTREDSNPVRTTQHSRTTEGRGPGSEEVGVFNETSVTENSLTGTEAKIFNDTESNTTVENLPASEEVIEIWHIPGAIKNLTVALVFDRNEMIRPTSEDIANQVPEEDILSRQLVSCRQQAAHALGLTGELAENISVHAMQFAWDEIPPSPKVSQVLLNVLEKSGGQFLVFGLTLFGFLYFVNVLRQAFETPELEEEMDEEEIKRRTSEEDVARMLDAQEQSVSDIRAKQIEDRIRKLVSDNPEEAANTIKRWLLDDEVGQ